MRLTIALLALIGCAEPATGAEAVTARPAPAPEPEVRSAPAPDPVAEPPPPLLDPRPDALGAAPAIEHPEALAPFFAALERVAEGQGVTRVSHMGDSSIGADDFPHRLRLAFQERYGDAGPGFVLLQAHGPSYRNRAVDLRTPVPWTRLCYIIHRCARDGRYGLGGARVVGPRGRSALRLRGERVVTRADLFFGAEPEGGAVRVRFDAGEWQSLDASAEDSEDRFAQLDWPAGAEALHVVPQGSARAYGVALENDGPGVVWDTLSMMGAFTPRVLLQDPAHFASQLAHRDPDLVVVQYGGNDLRRLVGGAVDDAGFEEETHALLARVRAAVPDAGCLLVGINDHSMSGDVRVRTADVERIATAQRAAAERAGCAHYSILDAMGGAGHVREWRRARLAGADGKHLTSAGRELLAARLFAAIEHAHGR